MSIESVEATFYVEGSGGLLGAELSHDREELASQIIREAETEAWRAREVVEECLVEKEVIKQDLRQGDSRAPCGPISLEAMEGIKAEHRRLWEKVKKKLVAGICKRDLKKGLEQLKVAKLAGDILSLVVRGQRQAWGLDALEGELSADDREEIIEEMASLTVPSRADKTLE